MRYTRVLFPVGVQWNDGPGSVAASLYDKISELTDEQLRTEAVNMMYGLTIREALDLVRGPLVIEKGEIAEELAS